MTEHPCARCHAALTQARIFYECTHADLARIVEIQADVARMYAEAKQMLARTIELNQRASLDLADAARIH